MLTQPSLGQSASETVTTGRGWGVQEEVRGPALHLY